MIATAHTSASERLMFILLFGYKTAATWAGNFSHIDTIREIQRTGDNVVMLSPQEKHQH